MNHHALLIDATNYVTTGWMADPGEGRAARLLRDGVRSFVDNTDGGRQAWPIAVFDAGGGLTFRHKLYPPYKAHRPAKEKGLVAELLLAWELLDADGFEVCSEPEWEADDLLATFAAQAVEFGWRATVWSRDKDLRQCLAIDGVELLVTGRRDRGEWFWDYLTPGPLQAKWGVRPDQWCDYRILVGDPSDGWDGAPGIGEKGAASLLQTYGTLDRVLQQFKLYPDAFRPAIRKGLQWLQQTAEGTAQPMTWGELGRQLMQLRFDARSTPFRSEHWPWVDYSALEQDDDEPCAILPFTSSPTAAAESCASRPVSSTSSAGVNLSKSDHSQTPIVRDSIETSSSTALTCRDVAPAAACGPSGSLDSAPSVVAGLEPIAVPPSSVVSPAARCGTCTPRLQSDGAWRCTQCGLKVVTAADLGLAPEAKVWHAEYGTCTVHRISRDGTSLQLRTSALTIEYAIAAETVKLLALPKPVAQPEPILPGVAHANPPETPAAAPPPAESGGADSYYAVAAVRRSRVKADARQTNLF